MNKRAQIALRYMFVPLLVVATACTAVPPAAPAQPPATSGATKTHLSVAFQDDPTRYAFLYAVQHGQVTSTIVELDLQFLPAQAIGGAFQTKQYDVVETAPTAVAGAAAAGFKTVITSTELEAKGASPLVVAADSVIKQPADLKGKTIAVPSLQFAIMVPLRLVLQQSGGLNADLQGGDVKWQEVAPDVAVGLLKEHKIDAALLLNQAAFTAESDGAFRTVFDAAKAYNDATKSTYVGAIVLSYPETLSSKHDAVVELNRMFRDSMSYLKQHPDQVLGDVAKDKNSSVDFLKWYFTQYDVPLGELNAQQRANIQRLWESAQNLGTLKQVPNVDELMLSS